MANALDIDNLRANDYIDYLYIESTTDKRRIRYIADNDNRLTFIVCMANLMLTPRPLADGLLRKRFMARDRTMLDLSETRDF